jgi:hypothetical protein
VTELKKHGETGEKGDSSPDHVGALDDVRMPALFRARWSQRDSAMWFAQVRA